MKGELVSEARWLKTGILRERLRSKRVMFRWQKVMREREKKWIIDSSI